jgi:DNA-directed RNA polymerase specialized sigma24 family protein
MMAASQRSHDRFANTRWSMVMQQASGDAPGASRALDELAQRYWYPVYAYVRRCGHAPAIAQDITRTFLHLLITQFQRNREQPPHGYFRKFLLGQLNTFLGGDWREAIGEDTSNALAAPPDLESRNQRDNAQAGSPEQAYQRSFAFEVLARALRRLQAEARQTGHGDMFEALQPYLSRDPVPGEYEQISKALHTPPLALVLALKRLRQRFRELASQELADTVTTAEELGDEQASLHAALQDSQAPQ